MTSSHCGAAPPPSAVRDDGAVAEVAVDPPARSTEEATWDHDAAERDEHGAAHDEDALAEEPPGSPPDAHNDEDLLEPFGDFANSADVGAPLDLPENSPLPDFEHDGEEGLADSRCEAHETIGALEKAPARPAADAGEDQNQRMLAFALGTHARAGEESLVRMLNSNIVQLILLCEMTVGPTRHYTNLSDALSSGQANCATVVRVNLEPGVYWSDYETDVSDGMCVHVRPVAGSCAGSVVLSSRSGRPLLRVAHKDAMVCVSDVQFISSNQPGNKSNLKQRCVWVTDGKLVLRNCKVSSEAGIGICLLRSGAVTCHNCDLSDCGFVAVAAAQGGTAKLLDGCKVMRNRHFGVLATDVHSSVLLLHCHLSHNGTYGVGVGAGATLSASHCQLLRNQVGIVSKGAGSKAHLHFCEISSNNRFGIGAREGATATATECKISRNQYGMCVSGVGSKGSLERCDMNNNVTHALGANDGGEVSAYRCQMRGNQVGVVSKGANSQVALRLCRTNDNARIGVGIREGGMALCQGCEMKGNQYGVCALNAKAAVTLLKCDASRNHRYGVSASDGGAVEAVDCTLNENLQLGIGAWHPDSRIMLVSCSANGNGRSGVAARAGSTMSARACSFSNNQQFGVYVCGQGSSIALLDCESSDNGLYGIGASEMGVAEVARSRTTRNVQAGVVAKDPGSSVFLRDCDASHNGRIGVAALVGGVIEAIGCTMRHNMRVGLGAWHPSSKVSLYQCEASDNGAAGLTAIEGGRVLAKASLFKGNSNVGVVAKDRGSVVLLDNCIASHNGCIGVGARGQGRVEAVSCSMLHNFQSGVASKDAGSVILLRRCRHSRILESHSVVALHREDTCADFRECFFFFASLNQNGKYGLSVREHAAVDAANCEIMNNRHMGACVRNASSTVKIRQCALANNTNYPLGVGDGATVEWQGADATDDSTFSKVLYIVTCYLVYIPGH